MINKNCTIFCNCGCDDGLVARILDGVIYISFVSSDFYTKQTSFNKIRFALKLFLGKRIVKDIVTTDDKLIELRDFLLSTNYDNDEKTNNDSHLAFEYDVDFGYMIYLISDINPNDAFKFNNHRLFEITLSKKERDLLVMKINKCLSFAKK